MSPAEREVFDGQVSGYWFNQDQPTPPPPTYDYTGAVLPRLGETALMDFVCLDLVLFDVGPKFIWLPLSEAGRYTYSHSLGLLYEEPWRFVVYGRGGSIEEYDVAYSESLPPKQIAQLYGRPAEMRAREDYPAVQLHLHRRSSP